MMIPPRLLQRSPQDQQVRREYARKTHTLRLFLVTAVSLFFSVLTLCLLLPPLAPAISVLGSVLVGIVLVIYHVTAQRTWSCPFCGYSFYHNRDLWLIMRNPSFCYRCGEALLPDFEIPPDPTEPEIQEFARRLNMLNLLMFVSLYGIALALIGAGLYIRGMTRAGTTGFLGGFALIAFVRILTYWNWRCPHCRRYLPTQGLKAPPIFYCPFCGTRLRSELT